MIAQVKQKKYLFLCFHKWNQIESKSRFFIQYRIKIGHLAKIPYRHSTNRDCIM